MLRKLISIGFAINIVLCSIGVQVIEHRCIWCGGDRLEFISHHAADESEVSCCSDHEYAHHDCKDEGCCQPRLLKLYDGVTSEDGFVLKRDELKPLVFDMDVSMVYIQGVALSHITNDYWDRARYRDISPPPAFLSPLRC